MINPRDLIPEISSSNNSLSLTRSFNPKSAVCLKLLPVNTDDGRRYNFSNPGVPAIINRFRSLWPTPQIRWFYSNTVLGKPFGGQFHMPDDGDWLILALFENNFWNGEPGWCTGGGARAHYIAMIHPDTNTTKGSTTKLGLGSYTEPLAWVKMVPTGSQPFDTPGGGDTLAHEASHNYNGMGNRWKHVNCGLPSADFNPGYPYPTSQIGTIGPDTYWGFDTISRTPIRPQDARDYMTYCGPKWISDYNWRGVYNFLNNGSLTASQPDLSLAQALPELADAPETLVLIGSVSDDPARTVASGYRLQTSDLSASQIQKLAYSMNAQTQGQVLDYALELVDGNNNLLYTQAYTVTLSDGFNLPLQDEPASSSQQSGSESAVLNYMLGVPYDPATAVIRVTRQGIELERLTVSANAPAVSIQTPSNGATIGASLNLTWSGSDADGDSLFYTVQYSPDAGTTWLALATHMSAASLTLDDTGELPASFGGQGQIRVIASDGVNTGMDTLTGLSVEPHAPQTFINSPTDQQIIRPGQQVLLEGMAIDIEDGNLSGSALVWDINGAPAGEGESLVLPDLAHGRYTLTLTATGSDGLSASASVEFFVADELLYLPLISK